MDREFGFLFLLSLLAIGQTADLGSSVGVPPLANCGAFLTNSTTATINTEYAPNRKCRFVFDPTTLVGGLNAGSAVVQLERSKTGLRSIGSDYVAIVDGSLFGRLDGFICEYEKYITLRAAHGDEKVKLIGRDDDTNEQHAQGWSSKRRDTSIINGRAHTFKSTDARVMIDYCTAKPKLTRKRAMNDNVAPFQQGIPGLAAQIDFVPNSNAQTASQPALAAVTSAASPANVPITTASKPNEHPALATENGAINDPAKMSLAALLSSIANTLSDQVNVILDRPRVNTTTPSSNVVVIGQTTPTAGEPVSSSTSLPSAVNTDPNPSTTPFPVNIISPIGGEINTESSTTQTPVASSGCAPVIGPEEEAICGKPMVSPEANVGNPRRGSLNLGNSVLGDESLYRFYEETSLYRIINGTAAEEGAWPWTCNFVKADNYSGAISVDHEYMPRFCGATIIARRWLLTAAHCFSNKPEGFFDAENPRMFICGARNISDATRRQVVAVEAIYVHPEFSYRDKTNDIALVKIDKDLQYTDTLKPACVPKAPIDSLAPPTAAVAKRRSGDVVVSRNSSERVRCFVGGWGLREDGVMSSQPYAIHQVPVDYVPPSECQQLALNAAREGIIPNKAYDTIKNIPNLVCAGVVVDTAATSYAYDSCQGDSGGTLMCHDAKQDRWLQHGVVSFGYTCGLRNVPGFYAGVYHYRNWILSTTANELGGLNVAGNTTQKVCK